ncbi:DUF4331 domain-containing protein [Pseudomonas aeruginosa]|uniref:DUF4331 domain-containing protein n=1 Tax=Pseudomonas aeruginosa TaxID=287 RepID=UPI0022322069|nr:DUF4331 domain-containing protein [Pseudomonas aeruginosa]MCW3964320.1 DUF4331 domain-containing protein [Pseudomonas aeruginosa]
MISSRKTKRLGAAIAALALGIGGATGASASDHLDTPSVIADPRADIGDIFAWTSGGRLNLVMTIAGHSFSPSLDYAFHIDSGARFGRTTRTTTIVCRLKGGEMICRADGLKAGDRRMQVFAGLRDDPFFNNVKGKREAYTLAGEALAKGLAKDEAGCPAFEATTSAAILDRWRHTGGGPAQNLLAGWTAATLTVSIDLAMVGRGGPMLAVWAETADATRRIDRMGRPQTGNALLGTLAPAAVSDALKEAYNRATPAASDAFVPEIEKALGLYDGFDGDCGNAFLADRTAGASRYLTLANLLADDRLWVNAAGGDCTTLFAVELAALGGRPDLKDDCGGRTPNYDAVDVYLSLLAGGAVSDGVDHDDQTHSTTVFPFLAAPADSKGAKTP